MPQSDIRRDFVIQSVRNIAANAMGHAPSNKQRPNLRLAKDGPFFRNDINALRALAASVVVLFHFNVPGFSGGYVGVDIFFVISGLLMTQIIVRGLDRGSFSLMAFYAARVRRIVPAMWAVSVALLVMGVLFVDPLTFGDIARNAAASLLFVSNMLYATQSGYFAESSDTNWLLHTWTLSVEWQFYMIYPIALIVMGHIKPLWRRRVLVIAASCIACLILTVYISNKSVHLRDYAFFLLPTRAWEMLAGGWIALWAPQLKRSQGLVATSAGAVLIALAIFWLDDAVMWPSIWTLLPVAGTALILIANECNPVWAKVPGASTLGLWSYSLYLWHWPVFVAIGYFNLHYTPSATAAGIALSVLLSGLSHSLIETRLRNAVFGTGTATSGSRWLAVGVSFAVTVGALAVAMVTHGFEQARTTGFDDSRKARLEDYRQAPADWAGMGPCDKQTTLNNGAVCQVHNGSKARVAVLGDSHSEQMLPRLKALSKNNDLSITLYRNAGCAPLPQLTWTRTGSECAEFYKKVFPLIREQHFDRLVLYAAWSLYLGAPGTHWKSRALCTPNWRGCRPETDDRVNALRIDQSFSILQSELMAIRSRGTDIAIVLPDIIADGEAPRALYKRTYFSSTPSSLTVDRRQLDERTRYVRKKLVAISKAIGAELIDPLSTECANTSCSLIVDGKYILKDTHHLRASVLMSDRFNYLDDFIKNRHN